MNVGSLWKLPTLATLTLGAVLGQVNVVTNGGFESGLSGWTAAPSAGNGINTTCSFNASTSGGTETQTGTSSLAPSAGTGVAMGSIKNTGSGAGAANSSCVLYQDVAIPAGATTATLTVRWGLIRVGAVTLGQAALLARLYSSTATVPYYLTSGVGAITFYQPASSDTSLVSATSGPFNVSSLAGTTARLALFIAMTASSDTGRATVGGFDEVDLSVSVAPTVTQSFGAATIPLNGSTSLTYTITNPAAAGATATAIGFTNTLPAGLVVATPNGLTGSCGGGAITAVAASGSVALSGASLAAGASCTFSVNVTGATAGTKNNSVTVSASTGSATATANLQVIGGPTLISVNPNSGVLSGGNSVTLTGTDFTGATSVTFGGVAATSFSVVNATTITAVVPAGAAGGAVSVIVTTPSGSNSANSLYQYLALPTITLVSPSSGPTTGGNSVTITGSNFTGATAVTFAGVPATSFAVVSSTSITAIVPAGGGVGVVSVGVVTPNGASAPNSLYQYVVPVPTLSEWGMIGLTGLLLLYGYRRLQGRGGLPGAA